MTKRCKKCNVLLLDDEEEYCNVHIVDKIMCADCGCFIQKYWKHFPSGKISCESCMANAKYMNTPLNITAPTVSIQGKSKKMSYSHTLEMPLFLGWKQVTIKTLEQTETIGLKMYLRTLLDRPLSYSKLESNVVIRNKVSYYSESSLIKKLEDLGIGRPSTFAMIVDTVQERNYVKCTDIEGKMHNCKEFMLDANKELTIKEIEKTFGNEKSKLQIQPLGVLCIEFLATHFDSYVASCR